MNNLNYRPDIDGLRAFAVISVILYHAGISWMPGGFVGVDIFFVISGYLISSIILSEISRGEFSFKHFFKRRLRRIIPALLVMLAIVIATFQVIALPEQAQDTATSGLAALFSVSNFWFWQKSGYFAPATEFMPLLHTWSLGVEEQFYLVFPVVLLVLSKIPVRMKWLLTGGTISLELCPKVGDGLKRAAYHGGVERRRQSQRERICHHGQIYCCTIRTAIRIFTGSADGGDPEWREGAFTHGDPS